MLDMLVRIMVESHSFALFRLAPLCLMDPCLTGSNPVISWSLSQASFGHLPISFLRALVIILYPLGDWVITLPYPFRD